MAGTHSVTGVTLIPLLALALSAGAVRAQTTACVILVGHSYAGMIITGVAEHAPDRIAHLVYVDALVPEHGQSAMDVLPEPTCNTFRKLADEGGGWRMRPNDHLLDLWGLEDGPARAFVQKRLADFTIRCFSQPLEAPTHALTSFLARTSRA